MNILGFPASQTVTREESEERDNKANKRKRDNAGAHPGFSSKHKKISKVE